MRLGCRLLGPLCLCQACPSTAPGVRWASRERMLHIWCAAQAMIWQLLSCTSGPEREVGEDLIWCPPIAAERRRHGAFPPWRPVHQKQAVGEAALVALSCH